MSIHPILAQRLMEERVKDALRKAEKARLVKMAQKSTGTRPLLSSVMRFLRAWWDAANGRNQPTIDDVKRRKWQSRQASG